MTRRGASLLFVMIAIAALGSSRANATAVNVTKVTNLVIEYKTYESTGTKTVQIADLELWSELPSAENPQGYWWASEPDFKQYLLQRGLARLRQPELASAELRAAEEQGKAAQAGMWKPKAPPVTVTTPPVDSTTTATVTETENTETNAPAVRTSGDTATTGPSGLSAWAPSIRQFLVAIVTFFGGWQLLVLIWAYFHRHRVFLVLLGEPNTGKSWLWHRLVDPSVSEAELRKVKKSDAVARLRHATLPMGKYEVAPIYTDVPGNQSGEQTSQLIDRKWFRFLQRLIFPQRRVWLILLAPSTDVPINSIAPVSAIDRDDLQRQLGALKLYTGILTSRKTPKPDFVAICIAKADLFMAQSPDDTTSRAIRDELTSAFSEHIRFVESACNDVRVKSVVIVCSALKGWNGSRILDALKTACYTGR